MNPWHCHGILTKSDFKKWEMFIFICRRMCAHYLYFGSSRIARHTDRSVPSFRIIHRLHDSRSSGSKLLTDFTLTNVVNSIIHEINRHLR